MSTPLPAPSAQRHERAQLQRDERGRPRRDEHGHPEREEHADLTIAGARLEVVSLTGEESISTLFRFEVTCASPADGPDPRALLGQPAAITLRDGHGLERLIHGIVAECTSRVFDSGGALLSAVIRPEVFALTLGRDSRVFQSATAVEIVQQVLGGSAAPSRWEVTGAPPKRAYCAQYREDDWTFIRRILEEEGIYFWFDHDGERSTLVFGDSSASAPDLAGGAVIPFVYESGRRAAGELIEAIGGVIQATSTKFTVGSFDPDRPLFKVCASGGEGSFEVYDAPGGGPPSPDVCAARARTMREASASSRSAVAGASTSVRLVPGRVVEVSGHPVARLDARYLVTQASYAVTQRRRSDASIAARPYLCRFQAVAQGGSYRPPAKAPVARQAGLQSGIVVGAAGQEVFPDASGRVRVQLRWDRGGRRDESSGKWMRVAQRGVGESMLFPRVGSSVLTFNEEGSVDAPSVLSRIHDAEHPPTYGLPANKTRLVFKTATTPGGGSHNEVRFEDRKGAEEMLIHASRDMGVLVKSTKQEVVGRDSLRRIEVDHDLGVAQDHAERVVADQKVTIGAGEELSIVGGRGKLIQGSEKETIAGDRSLTTAASSTTTVGGKRYLVVGTALVDASLGSISTSGKTVHIVVGGAKVAITAANMTENAKYLGVQSIGCAKLEYTKKQRKLEVKKRHFETVGAAMVLDTKGAFGETASDAASYWAGALLSAKAPDVVIEASEKIEIRCGTSVITILPTSVEISATSFKLEESAAFVAVTKKIEHNC